MFNLSQAQKGKIQTMIHHSHNSGPSRAIRSKAVGTTNTNNYDASQQCWLSFTLLIKLWFQNPIGHLITHVPKVETVNVQQERRDSCDDNDDKMSTATDCSARSSKINLVLPNDPYAARIKSFCKSIKSLNVSLESVTKLFRSILISYSQGNLWLNVVSCRSLERQLRIILCVALSAVAILTS